MLQELEFCKFSLDQANEEEEKLRKQLAQKDDPNKSDYILEISHLRAQVAFHSYLGCQDEANRGRIW